MKTIIAGSRDIKDYAVVESAVADSGFTITEVVSGCAQGVDLLAIQYAEQWGLPVKRMPVLKFEWERHGKFAGPLRNRRMAEYADALVAIWDGKSRGTENMINEAKARGLKVHVNRI